MAFPVVASFAQNSKFNPSGSVAVNKPTGLAVGDLMVAYAVSGDQSNSGSGPNAPDGTWTLLLQGSGSNVGSASWWKFATSADVAASSFTFTFADTANAGCINAAIIRITGTDATSAINASNHAVQSGATSLSTTGITPGPLQQLFLALGAAAIGTSANRPTTITTFAVANSNPSWTSIFDVLAGTGSSGFENTVLAASWANETANGSTATGSLTATVDKAPTYSDIQIIAITPPITVPAVPPLSAVSAIPAPAFALGISVPQFTAVVALIAPTFVELVNKWKNVAKNAASWLNTPKS